MSNNELVRVTTEQRIRTIRMNNPKRLNGWTLPMLQAWQAALREAAGDDGVDVVILTGTDPYYSAGVHLSGTLGFAHPTTLHEQIRSHNEALFDAFVSFPKPIIAAVNGPAIGAAVTTATLCDALIGSERATFSTPFARLGAPAEGCSSVTFEILMGQEAAARMLGDEGWVPSAKEALDVGLADEVVAHDVLLDVCSSLARSWQAEGRARTHRSGLSTADLQRINAEESVRIADAFLAPPFLEGQYRFLRAKGKKRMAAMFWMLWRSHPLWSRLR